MASSARSCSGTWTTQRPRGELASLLYASEASIHGRFGYGTASQYVEYELDPRRAAFHTPGQDSGRMRLVEGDEALRLLPEVHDRHRRRQPGNIARFPGCRSC